MILSYFSKRTVLEVLSAILINLTSGWLGVLLITPGILGVPLNEYLNLLILNLPFGIVGMIGSFWLTQRSKLY